MSSNWEYFIIKGVPITNAINLIVAVARKDIQNCIHNVDLDKKKDWTTARYPTFFPISFGFEIRLDIKSQWEIYDYSKYKFPTDLTKLRVVSCYNPDIHIEYHEEGQLLEMGLDTNILKDVIEVLRQPYAVSK